MLERSGGGGEKGEERGRGGTKKITAQEQARRPSKPAPAMQPV